MFKTLSHAVHAGVLKSIEHNTKSIYERENKFQKLIENKVTRTFLSKYFQQIL